MAKKIMLINATDSEEIRVATLLDGQLSDFDIEFVHNEKIKGNIYKAKIVRVDTSLQAAFVHYGGQKNGFLPIGELPRDMVSPDGRRGRIQDLLHRDQEIMVQAVREELGPKGAMVSGQVSLPGRYLVLTPGSPLNGISRKIESREEREHFKRLIDELEIPKNFGVIVRTASLGVTKEDFERDLEYLLDTWREVQSRFKHRQGPGLVWQEDDVVTRTLRDSFSKDMEEVHIDDLDTYQAAQAFFRRTMPQHTGVLRHYTGKKPLFSKHQTEEQIDRIYARKVGLPSGGAIVLDQTEALVAIDVNSGKTTGDNQEDTACKTNLEAAEEIARQLRLRDLAGLIVIDFIDMKREGNNRAVMERLVDCLKEDKARMEVGKINRFGVLVLTRQRIRPSIQHVTHETCPTCQGTGQVKSIEALVLSVVRRIKSALSREGVAEIRVRLSPEIALSVLNQKRKDLADAEEASGSRVLITADATVAYGEMFAEIERREDEPQEKAPASKPSRERDPEDETVVLGGDAPISFEKALGTDSRREEPRRVPVPAAADIKYDRRDAQRAALEERERLRSLFESAKPEDEDEDEAPQVLEARATGSVARAEAPVARAEAPTRSEGGRHGRGRGRGGVTGAAAEEPNLQPQPPRFDPRISERPTSSPAVSSVAPAEVRVQVQVLESAPEPPAPTPIFDPALLLGAAKRPALGPVTPEPEAAAPKKGRGRPPKAKAEPKKVEVSSSEPPRALPPLDPLPGRRLAAAAPPAQEQTGPAPAPKKRGRPKKSEA